MFSPKLFPFLLLLALLVACSSPYEENEQQMIDDDQSQLITREVGTTDFDTTYQANEAGGQAVVGTVQSYETSETEEFGIGGPTNRYNGENVWADAEADDLKREFEGNDPSQVDDQYTYDYRRVVADRIGSVDTDAGYPNRSLASNPGISTLGTNEPKTDDTPFLYDPVKRTTDDKLYNDDVFTYEAMNNSAMRKMRRNELGIQLEEQPETSDLAGEVVVPKVVGYEDDLVSSAAADEAVSRSIYADTEDEINLDVRYRAKGPTGYTSNSLWWAYTTNSLAQGNYSSVIWAGGKTYNNDRPNLTNAEMVDGDGYTPLPVPRDEQ